MQNISFLAMIMWILAICQGYFEDISDKDNCGISPLLNNNQRSKRAHYGQDAMPHAYPWMVNLIKQYTG